MIRKINRGLENILSEGVRETSSGFIIDFTSDRHNDIVKITKPTLYQTELFGNVYWFGYRFEDSADSRSRAKFTRWIKGLSDDKPSETELRQFIERPLSLLNKSIPLSTVSGFVYPLSGRSELVSIIVKIANSYLPHDIDGISFELMKNIPSNVGFDWNGFEHDVVDKMSFRDRSKYISKTLLPSIHSSEYFSIGEVPPKYRPYVKDYLVFKDKDTEDAIQSIESGRLLLIDDIDTTRSTLKEMLRIVNKVNPKCEVYIFTLIGKE